MIRVEFTRDLLPSKAAIAKEIGACCRGWRRKDHGRWAKPLRRRRAIPGEGFPGLPPAIPELPRKRRVTRDSS
jgi:hypothetical protein